MNETFFKAEKLLWLIKIDIYEGEYAVGPYCPNCKYELINTHLGFTCENCGRKFEVTYSLLKLKDKVVKLKQAFDRSSYPIISLDELPRSLKIRDEDEKYFMAAKIGQKDGKSVGVVYFGEKAKDQRKEDYSQIFIDLDDEQLRFDKSNKHPKDILAKFKAEFSESSTELISSKTRS